MKIPGVLDFKTIQLRLTSGFAMAFFFLAGCGEFYQNGALGFRKNAKLLNLSAKTQLSQLSAGTVLDIDATFDTSMEVVGTPGINLEIGGSEKWATYVSGSGTPTLTFSYTVESGLSSAEIKISTSEPFRLSDTSYFAAANGSKITASVTSEIQASPLQNQSTIVAIDSMDPYVTGLTALTPNGAYNAGDVITVYLNFNETVAISGTAQITLEMGATDRTVACTLDITTNARWICSYTVQAGDTSSDLDLVSGGMIDLTGVTVTDSAGNLLAAAGVHAIALPNGGVPGSLSANTALVIDTTSPTITSVTSPNSDGTYPITGDINSPYLTVTLNFSEPVTLVRNGGSVTLQLNTDNDWDPSSTQFAYRYSDATTVSQMDLSYSIGPTDYAADLNYASIGSFVISPGVTLTDAAGNPINTDLPATGSGQSLGGSKNIKIEARSNVKDLFMGSSATDEHRCALFANGTPFCWGNNTGGQLGQNGTTAIGSNGFPGLEGPISSPFAGTYHVKSVALGYQFTCFLYEAGQVGCVGTDAKGQLGDGAGTGLISFSGGLPARKITAGFDHACAILADGSIQCWGDNTCGQLGVATTGDCDTTTDQSTSPATTVTLGAGRTAVDISAGNRFTCALLDDASIKCWGKNNDTLWVNYGMLGANSAATYSDSPLSVQDLGDAPAKPTQISSGYAHTCALLANGQVLCWGSGTHGQLGVSSTNWMGNSVSVMDATRVAQFGTSRAVQVSAGGGHSCVLLDTGNVRCWGRDQKGQLGLNRGLLNTTSVGDDELPSSVSAISLGGKAIAVAAGTLSTCALLSSGEVSCWGENSASPLGHGFFGYGPNMGDNEHPSFLGPIYLGGPKLPKQISAGGGHNCALFTDGTAKCWGDGSNGRLGNGSGDPVGTPATPIAAQSFLTAGLDGLTTLRFKQIVAAAESTCALLDQGDIKCWGRNNVGQLGLGTTTDRGALPGETPDSLSPQVIHASHKSKKLVAGKAGVCSVLSSGEALCWGKNEYGQLGMMGGHEPPPNICSGNANNCLGDDEALTSVTPKSLSGGTHILDLSVGSDQSCAIGSDRKITCVGSGFNGSRGTGDFSGASDFSGATSANLNGDGALSISTGENYSCSVLATGRLACWGDGSNSKLGRDFTPEGNLDSHYGNDGSESPLSLRIDDTQFYQFALASFKTTFGILSSGLLKGWGASSSGTSTNKLLLQNSDQTAPISLPSGTLTSTLLEAQAGVGHGCALFSDGTVRCWGVGSDGELGDLVHTSFGDAGDDLSDITPIAFE